MKVLVTGATGFIGRHLCHHLAGEGHALRVVSRSPSRAGEGLPDPVEVTDWGSLTGPSSPGALDGIDAVVNLAGETLAGRWTTAKRDLILTSRVVTTRHLVDGMRQSEVRPRVLVSASAVGYYGDRGEEELTEESAPGSGFTAELCRAWEAEARRAEDLGVRVVRFRIGIVLGAHGGALAEMVPMFRRGLGGPFGNGRQWWPWIHVDDLSRLIAWALAEDSLSGPVNAVSSEPVRQVEFARTLGGILHRPTFLWAPAMALRLVLGGFSGELLSSRRALPSRVLSAGFGLTYPRLQTALAKALS